MPPDVYDCQMPTSFALPSKYLLGHGRVVLIKRVGKGDTRRALINKGEKKRREERMGFKKK